MVVEKYSHVMHIVSNVDCIKSKDFHAIDVLKACFPAGTVSGAPKIRAMQIIEELEKLQEGYMLGQLDIFHLMEIWILRSQLELQLL